MNMDVWGFIALQVTSVGAILAFLAALILPYKALVKSKEGEVKTKESEIQLLQQRLNDYKEKIQELNDAAPDKLVSQMKVRVDYLIGQLEAVEKEKSKVEGDLKERMLNEDSENLRAELSRLETLILAYEQNRILTLNSLQNAEEPYLKFFEYYGGELTVGRRISVDQVVRYLGAEKVLNSLPYQIVDMFDELRVLSIEDNLPKGMPFFRGEISGFNAAGLVTNEGRLTQVGVAMLKKIAKDQSLEGGG